MLGSRIAEALAAQGHQLSPFGGDVRDSQAIEIWANGCQWIVHAAAMVPVKDVAARLGEAIAVNVAGTAIVAQAAARAGARFAYISSSHVYRASDRPLAETEPVEGTTLYGRTKLQGEAWAEALAPGALVLRVFSFFDPRQPTSYLVPALRARVQQAPAGAELVLDGGGSVRDIAPARWLAQRCAALIGADATGIVNVGTGLGHRVLDIAWALAGTLGRDDLTWRAADGVTNSLMASVERLVDLTGPLHPPSLSATLADYARSVVG